MKYVLFSIDNWNDTHTLAKFLRHIDTQRASSLMKGQMQMLIGSYQGTPELSFIMLTEDFDEWVIGSGYVDNQVVFWYVDEHMNVESGFMGIGVLSPTHLELPDFSYSPVSKHFFQLKEKLPSVAEAYLMGKSHGEGR